MGNQEYFGIHVGRALAAHFKPSLGEGDRI